MKKIKEWSKDFYNWYLLILTVLVILPILAPIFMKINWVLPAKAIYFVYSFFCHQFATRSIHIFDYQFAWCARDTGIWFGVAATAWLIKFKKLKAIKWYWIIPFTIPIALDGGLQTIFTLLNIGPTGALTSAPIYISNNFARFFTGAFFGIGLSLWISGSMFADRVVTAISAKSDGHQPIPEEKKPVMEQLKDIYNYQRTRVLTLFASLLIVYIILVQIWQVTSVVNKPSDYLDSAVKTTNEDFFIRRADGICPTPGIKDLFVFNCFFGK